VGGIRRGRGGTEAAAQRARTDVEATWTGLAERRTRDGEGGAGGVGARRSVAWWAPLGDADGEATGARQQLWGNVLSPGGGQAPDWSSMAKEAVPCRWLASVEGRTLARGGSGAVRKR
jgi:hypothetical protein